MTSLVPLRLVEAINPVPFDPIKAARRLSDLGLSAEKLPRHIAIIMDGNGRWARARGFPRIEGHRRGVRSVRETIEECAELGIEQLTLYCLSSENWNRPQRELDMLMRLLEQYLVEERSEIMRQDLRFAMIGRREGLSDGVLREVAKTCEVSRNNRGTRLCLAVNYGGRQELVDAFRRIAIRLHDGSLAVDAIDEECIAEHLDTAGMPDPDLVIRTAGEMRMSNYLLWQASYAEFWVTQKFWPEFRPADLHDALRDYAQRERRFGGLSR
jgi:undecaprenyl diphosphate synthase